MNNLKKKNARKNIYPSFIFLFLFFGSIIFLVTGCGCSVRSSKIDTNIKSVNPSELATACINNLENGDAALPVTEDNGDLYKDFRGGFIPNKNPNNRSMNILESQNNDATSAGFSDPKLNQRFTTDDEQNTFLFSNFISIHEFLQNTFLQNTKSFDFYSKQPEVPYIPNNGILAPEDILSKDKKYIAPTYSFDANERLGLLAFGGDTTSHGNSVIWNVHGTSDYDKGNYYNTNIEDIGSSDNNSDISYMDSGSLILYLGVSNNPKNTASSDIDHYLILQFAVNSLLFYSSSFTKNNVPFNSNLGKNPDDIGKTRTLSDLNSINNNVHGAPFSNLFEKDDLENNFFLFQNFLGYI